MRLPTVRGGRGPVSRGRYEIIHAETADGPLDAEGRALLATTEGRAALARVLLQQGRLDAARALFLDVLDSAPDHGEAQIAIAAIESESGERDDAHARLRAFFEKHPLSAADPDAPERPLALKIRGFERTEIMLAHGEEGWRPRFRGGHFATTFLIERPDFALRTFTIAGDNLERADALPPHDLLINTVADPDVEGAALDALARHLARNPGTAVINHPDRVRETARDRNWQRLDGFEGIRFPRTQRLELAASGAAEIARMLDGHGLALPLILRRAGTQTGRTVALIRTLSDLDAYAAGGLSGTYFAIAFHPILWRNEFYRKLRLFCIDGTYYPVVCHLDRVWNVHGGNRCEVMRPRDDLIAEEKRFLADWRRYVGAPNVRRLERLGALVGLDFFGIDFTLDATGTIFVYELNAAMRHSFEHAENFPYKLPYDRAISAAFTRMVRDRMRAGRSA